MARRRKKLRSVQPLPEMLTTDAWQVREGSPCVDLPARIMSVPLDDSPASAYMRAHEMVHVKITPHLTPEDMAKKHGITPLALQCVEDMRVHDFMRARDIPRAVVSDFKETSTRVGQLAEQTRTLTSLVISLQYCNRQREILEEALEETEGVDLSAIWAAAEVVTEFYETTRAKLQVAGQSPVTDRSGFESLTVPTAKLFDLLFSGAADDAMPISDYIQSCSQQENEWGTLEPPRRVPMTLSRKSKRGGERCWREEGTVPSAMYRLTLDNRVFARKRKEKGGTVLIDASGSMDFSTDDLAAVIAAAPGATIAAYAGSRDRGRLIIVAANGKMATADAIEVGLTAPGDGERMHGNVVDGPALRWLAKQPGPRIWVSDGIVTGRDDVGGINLVHEVNAICRQADVERILRWRDVVEALR